MSRVLAALADAAGQMAATLARLCVVSVFIITFLAQPSQIPSASMEHTMLVGDFVLVNKQAFAPAGHWRGLLPYRTPQRDDIIVFHYPVDPRELLVKRVIAVPGDRLHLRAGQVFLNGASLREPFAEYTATERSLFRDEFPNLQHTDPSVQAAWWIELRRSMQNGDLPVPAGRYFAMGDNRNNSSDSRFWGFVPRNNIVGEPLVVYLSTDRTTSPRGTIRWNRMLHVVR